MPPRHVIGVGAQVGASLVELVVKRDVEVMRLQIGRGDHRRHGAWEFAEAIENILRLKRHTFFELLAVDRRGGPDFPRLLPWVAGLLAQTNAPYITRIVSSFHHPKVATSTNAFHLTLPSRLYKMRCGQDLRGE